MANKKKKDFSHLKNHLYENSINSLIAEAEEYANSSVDRKNFISHEEWGAAWNRHYHWKMDTLASKKGLRNKMVEVKLPKKSKKLRGEGFVKCR